MRLTRLLDLPRSPDPADPADFDARALAAQEGSLSTLEQAACAGRVADRLGYAFGAGYRAGLRHMLGEPPESRLAATLAYTESGGPSPRNVRAALTPDAERAHDGRGAYRLSGEKSFATLASTADLFLIVARLIDADPTPGRAEIPTLRLVRLAPDHPGLSVLPRDPFPLAPELSHARLRLDGCPIDAGQLLPGDGYAAWIKPFRMIEDVHVLAATLGYLLRCCLTEGWPEGHAERLLAALAALAGIGELHQPAAHLAFAGILADIEPRLDALPWRDPEAAARWERDRPLLSLAAPAQQQRHALARQRL